jgi:hypothetical protein
MEHRDPGVYFGLTEEEYNETAGLRHSDVMAFADPKDKPGRKSAIVGTSVHALGLQGEEQAKRVFRVCLKQYNLRKKDEKAEYAEEQAKHPDKLVLRPKEFEQVWAMVEALRSPQADGCAELHPASSDSREVVIVGELWPGGPLAKARLDFFGPIIRDLKTTHEIDPQYFGAAIVKYGYHSQLAFYERLAAPHLPEIQGRELFCVSSREPHNRWIVNMDEDYPLLVQAGMRDVVHLIGCMKREQDAKEKTDH